MGRIRVPVLDEPLGGRDEVVEDVLLPQLRPGLVPLLPVLPAASEVGLGVDAPHLHPEEVPDAEPGHRRDVESPISGEVRRVPPVPLQVPPVADEHGHPGPVLARVEDLLSRVFPRVVPELRSPEDCGLVRLDVVPVDRAWVPVAHEHVEGLGIPMLTFKAHDVPQTRELDVPHEDPVHGVDLHPAVGVVDVGGDEHAPYEAHGPQ